ncbi:diacylglycerol/lipid kinase family protein [Virgibacillus flavescens]|uniref:diacylglycerol/lipid kinase family protein n=1 Tax=Virgibacillus flavescens TaxID=1611422 RepID=UPI003D32C05D
MNQLLQWIMMHSGEGKSMHIFIVNPKAGNGRAKKVFSKIAKSDLYQQINSLVMFTKYPGHAEEITSCLHLKYSNITCLIVIGGDGTIHEVLNGLQDKAISIAYIPGGSGNDFARGCGIKGKPLLLFQQIVKDPSTFPYWLGNYEINGTPRHFVNSFGFGFDAAITHAANKSIYKKILNLFRLATFTYSIALLHLLFRFRPIDVVLTIDDKKRFIPNCWMVTAANHPFYGGGMKIIPDAQIQPDTFPVLILHSISRLKVLALFITVFSGKHINFKEVEIVQVHELEIAANTVAYYQVDGQPGVCSTCKISKQSQSISVIKTSLVE